MGLKIGFSLFRVNRTWIKTRKLLLIKTDKGFLDSLRKAMPKDVAGFDLNVSGEQEIITSLRLVENEYQLRYKAAYNLALGSGLRLTEVARFMKSFDIAKVESFGGFHVAPLGYFRGTKLAYFAFFTDYTFKLIKNLTVKDLEFFSDRTISNYFRQVEGFEDVTCFKYLRKFANDVMTDEELNIPESVADFIQGKTPKSVGAKHYMKLKRKADSSIQDTQNTSQS
jgi:intergrase/recombinase